MYCKKSTQKCHTNTYNGLVHPYDLRRQTKPCVYVNYEEPLRVFAKKIFCVVAKSGGALHRRSLLCEDL